MNVRPFALCVLLLWGLSSPARAGDPANSVPAGALLYVGWAGSEGLEAPFQHTAMGKIFNEPSVQRLWAVARPMFGQGVAMATQGDEQAMGLASTAMNLLQPLWKYPTAFAVLDVSMGPAGPQLDAVLTVEAGEQSSQLAAQMNGLVGMAGLPPGEAVTPGEDATLKGELVRIALPGTPFVITHGTLGAHYVLATSDRAMMSLTQRLSAGDGGLATDARFTSGRARLLDGQSVVAGQGFFDVAQTRQRVLRLMAELEMVIPPPVETILAESGLDRVGCVTHVMALHGDGFRRGTFVEIEGMKASSLAVTDAELQLIPRDTTLFTALEGDLLYWFDRLVAVLSAVDPQMANEFAAGIDQVEQQLGFKVRDDFLASLGRRFFFFEEPAIRSFLVPGFVAAVKPHDFEKFNSCIEKIASLACGIASQSGEVKAELRTLGEGTNKITFLHMSGQPLPVAPSWGRQGDFMTFGLYPSTIQEVRARTDGADAASSIATNADFQRVRGKLPTGLADIMYYDTRATFQNTYPLLLQLGQMGIAMIPMEIPGVDASLLPPPSAISKHLFGDVMVGGVVDGGYLSLGHGPLALPIPDISSVALVSFGAGLLVPTVNLARGRADATIRLNQMKQIGLHASLYAQDHQDAFPSTLEALYEFSPELPRAPYPIVYLGQGMGPTSSADLILAYDPNGANGRHAAVYVGLFAEILTPDELQMALRQREESGKR